MADEDEMGLLSRMQALNFLGSGLGISTLSDRFSVSGKGGPYLCRAGTVTRVAAIAARRTERARATEKAQMAVREEAVAPEDRVELAGRLRPTLLSMPKTQRRLQAMLEEIEQAWPYKGVPGARVLISVDLGYEVEARPDWTIIVPLGVLADEAGEVSSQLTDGELYWLLGRAYAHLALGHFEDEGSFDEHRRSQQSLSRVYERNGSLEDAIRYARSTSRQVGGGLAENYDATLWKSRHIRFSFDRVTRPTWRRYQEDEVDAAALDLVYLLGISPDITTSLRRAEMADKSRVKRLDTLLSLMDERTDQLTAAPEFREALASGPLATRFEEIFETLRRGLYDGLRFTAQSWFLGDRRSPRSREEGISRYRREAFGRTGLAEFAAGAGANRETVGPLLADPELTEGLKTARAMAAADAALEGDPVDLAEADRQIAIALKGQLRNASSVRFLAYEVAVARGDTDAAMDHLGVAVQGTHPVPEAFRELARLQTLKGQLAGARAIADDRRRAVSDRGYFLPAAIRLAGQSRRFDAMDDLVASCQATGRPVLEADCDLAVLDLNYGGFGEPELLRLLANKKPTEDKPPAPRRPQFPRPPWDKGG